jgi:hypothetical protein
MPCAVLQEAEVGDSKVKLCVAEGECIKLKLQVTFVLGQPRLPAPLHCTLSGAHVHSFSCPSGYRRRRCAAGGADARVARASATVGAVGGAASAGAHVRLVAARSSGPRLAPMWR